MANKKSLSMDEKRELKWRAEDDARILKRALEIQRDKSRTKMAKETMNKELKELASLTGNKVVPKVTKSKVTKSKVTKKRGAKKK